MDTKQATQRGVLGMVGGFILSGDSSNAMADAAASVIGGFAADQYVGPQMCCKSCSDKSDKQAAGNSLFHVAVQAGVATASAGLMGYSMKNAALVTLGVRFAQDPAMFIDEIKRITQSDDQKRHAASAEPSTTSGDTAFYDYMNGMY